MDEFASPLELVRTASPERPVTLARPDRLVRSARWFQSNFPGTLLYAVKANPSPWVISGLAAAGVDMFDIASTAEAELVRALAPHATLAYNNPVKSRASIARAYHEFGCRIFALDHIDELAKIEAATNYADDLTLIVRLAVDNAAAALPLAGKFGASIFDAPALLQAARARAARLGVTFHVGSQCMEPSAYAHAMRACSTLIARAGVTVDIVNCGGGFPSLYPGLTPPPLTRYAQAIEAASEEMLVMENAELWCEPGRALVAEAGSVLARIELRKGDALYLNDGAFGNLFDAAHLSWRFPARLIRASEEWQAEEAPFRLFGPTCDSMDAMPGPFPLPADADEGDYIEIGLLGAYGAAMASKFNGFGDADAAIVSDWPWQSIYDEQYAVEWVAASQRKRRGRGAAEAGGR